MTLSLRTRLLLAAAVPPAGLAALAAVGPPPAIFAAAAVAAAGVAALGVVLLTRDFLRLQQSADRLLHRLDAVIESGEASGGYPVTARDGTGAVATTLAEAETSLITLGRLLRQREANTRDALARAAKALTAAADGKPATAVLVLPDVAAPQEAQQLVAAVGKLAAAHAAEVKRANAFLCILHDIPDPVLVLDSKSLELSFLNTAAERFYPHLVGQKKKPTLAEFFVAPPSGVLVEHDAPTVDGPAALREWLVRGNGGIRTALAGGLNGQTAPVEVAATPQFERKSAYYVTALVRDLSAAREADSNSRRRQRQLVGQRLCRLLSRESKPALAVMRTQANLLSQAAKQLGQRDRLLPKVQRIVEETCRQELVVDLLDWMGMLSAGQAGDPDTQEVRLGDVAKTVGDRLRPGFEERGNSLDVTDEAGWVLADEDWVAALVTGLLAHANQACERATIRLALGRRTAVQAHDEYAVVTVSYPGKPLPAHLTDDVRDPFRRPDSSVFDPDRPGGLPLGLAVAHKLAGLMYGEFLADTGVDNWPFVRVVLPTRIGKPRAVEIAQAVSPTPLPVDDDMLGGWGVGGGKPTTDDEPEPVAVSVAGPVEDDTAGNWFGRAGD